jgi:hypothetical protein
VSLFRSDLPVELEVGFGPHQEQHCLLVGIFPGLVDPAVETGEALLVVDAEGEEDAADALVEGTHDGAEGLLAGLSGKASTVSQICSLTCVLSSTRTVLEVNSTPTVTLYWSVNSPFMYLVSIAVFPTPHLARNYPGGLARSP